MPLLFLERATGQCQINNIPLQNNFDISRYLGLWYEMGSYSKNDLESRNGSADHAFIWTRTNGQTDIKHYGRDSLTANCRRFNPN